MEQLKRFMRAGAGVGLVFVGLFSALCTAMAIGDISNGIDVGTATGLMIFFGGTTAMSAWGAKRLLLGSRAAATTTKATTTTTTTGVDIALEARVLRVAEAKQGRVTPIEIALGCGVSLDAATSALEQLVMRGHAELAVADDGSTLYLIKGFLSVEAKQEAELVV